MFLFKFKTVMMVFLLHHADNKWKMCHDVCILNRKKKLFISHICMFCLVNMLVYLTRCALLLYHVYYIEFCMLQIFSEYIVVNVSHFCLCSFLKQKSDKCHGSFIKLCRVSVKILCTRHPIFL